MKNGHLKHVAALIGLVLTLPAQGGCTVPVPPSKVPDGVSAAEQDMLNAMQTLKHYATDVTSYIKCLEFEVSQNRMAPQEQAQLHNAVIDALQGVTAKFNEQVRIFKEKHRYRSSPSIASIFRERHAIS